MKTKDEERKALEEIRAIIHKTGKDSYLDMTFKGILEQAEENINNDTGCNYKEAYETALDRIRALQTIENENNKTISDMTEIHKNELDRLNNKLILAQQNYEIAASNSQKAYEAETEARKEIEEKDKTIKAQEYEILILKARLYDYMNK